MIYFSMDYKEGSNPYAIYLEAISRNIKCICKDKKGTCGENCNYSIGITNNGRHIKHFPFPFKVNTQHGFMFLGTVQQEEGIDCYLVESEEKKQLCIKNGIKEDNLIITDRPRMDFLYNLSNDFREKKLLQLGLNPNKKTIMYAPTWNRKNFGGGDKGFFANWFNNEGEELTALSYFLRATKNYNIIIRLHDHYIKQYENNVPDHIYNILSKQKNIVISSMVSNPNSLEELFVSDLLITDYSSISGDFLALNRPIIYIEAGCGWIWNAENKWFITPEERTEFAYVINDYKNFDNTIQTAFNNSMQHSTARKYYQKMIIGNVDGQASKRALDKILEKWNNIPKT